MASVCFYFQVHQPWRIKKYRVFDIGQDSKYFNDESDSNLNNQKLLQKVAKEERRTLKVMFSVVVNYFIQQCFHLDEEK